MTCAYDVQGRLVEDQTTPEPLERWRGPNGYTLISWEVDFRTGGSRLWLRSSEGQDYWVEGLRLEIVEPERVVFTGILGMEDEHRPRTAGTMTFRRT
jgi:uncharacterized protein YndB with AHSA1/START domain